MKALNYFLLSFILISCSSTNTKLLLTVNQLENYEIFFLRIVGSN